MPESPFLVCGICGYPETRFPIRYWHIMASHAALDHCVNLREIYRSERIEAPSSTVAWRLPDGADWAFECVETPTDQERAGGLHRLVGPPVDTDDYLRHAPPPCNKSPDQARMRTR